MQGLARDKVFGLHTLHFVIVANAREEQFRGRFIGLTVSPLLGYDKAGHPGGNMKQAKAAYFMVDRKKREGGRSHHF